MDSPLGFRLYTASRLITQAYRPLLESLGLTYPQYLVMLVLWEKDNRLVGDICRRLMLDTNTLTPLLQRMEREGLIIRTRGIADGRQTLISLTKRGQHLEEQAASVPENIAATWLCSNVEQDDISHLSTTLDKIIECLSKK